MKYIPKIIDLSKVVDLQTNQNGHIRLFWMDLIGDVYRNNGRNEGEYILLDIRTDNYHGFTKQ